MKKSLIILLAIISLTILHNHVAMAEADYNILSSSGTASMNAEPDIAVFTLAVETENKLLDQAMKDNNNKANKVVLEIKKLLGKNDSIKTEQFNVNPIYNYDYKEKKSVLTGYRITNSVNIKTKKISDVGKLMDTAIKCGANRAENLEFIIENKDKYADILLKQAAESAKQKASVTAKALGLCITGTKRVSLNFSDEFVPPYYRGGFSSMMKSSAEASTPPIESGELKLQAVVNVDFLIENIK